ncbi:hypothetical protein Sjap_026256 [Stephania japonica]|uniref:Uncharacterized protein n=1 Tax=Stephania japonica TaxID=461633 RepID=A0AAP0HK99_9MAGN
MAGGTILGHDWSKAALLAGGGFLQVQIGQWCAVLRWCRDIAWEEPASSFRMLGGLCPSDVALVLRYCPGRASVLFPYAVIFDRLLPHLPEPSKGKEPSLGDFCEDLRLDSSTLA